MLNFFKKNKIAEDSLTKVVLKVRDMHCSSCAMSIDTDLEELDGVKAAKTSYGKQTVEVEFDIQKVDQRRLIQTIKKTGYTATLD